MEELEDNTSFVHAEPFYHKKPDTSKSPDVNNLQKVWVSSARCWMYFKKEATEAFIMERINLYKMRDKYTRINKIKEE